MKKILFWLTITATFYTPINCAEKTQSASITAGKKDLAQTEKTVEKLDVSPCQIFEGEGFKQDDVRSRFRMIESYEELPWDEEIAELIASNLPKKTQEEVPYHLLPTLLTQELHACRTRKECYETLKTESKSEKKGRQDTQTTWVDNAPAKSTVIELGALADVLKPKSDK